MSKEIFVIYNSKTGFIEGGAGKIDRVWDTANADGSTMSERIPLIMAKDPDRAVVYLPYQKLPDPGQQKIFDGKIADLTQADLDAIEAARPPTIEERVEVLEQKEVGPAPV